MKHIKVCISCFADEKECRCEDEQELKDFCDDCNCQLYRQVGNAVPPPMGRWIGEQIQRYFN